MIYMPNYTIHHNKYSEDFREPIKILFNKHNEEFEPNLEAYEDNMDEVVDSFTDDAELIYAKSNNNIIGILIITTEGYREPISEYCPCVYIRLALVDSNHRRNNVGEMMIKKCIKQYNNHSRLCLRTKSDNTQMQKFCKNLGFTKEGENWDKGCKRLYYCYPINKN